MSSFLLTDLEQVDEEFNHTSLYRSDSVDNTETNNVYEKIENFERFSTAGTFILHQWKNQDLIPPAKITDLKVKSYDVANRTVMLQWTSPGDNMTDGQGMYWISFILLNDIVCF